MAKSMKFTKIVATLGPNSRNPDIVEALLREGADVIRLNFSHGSHEDHALSVRLVREAARKLNRHIAIFQDLQGPKIRLGQLEGEFLDVATGETLVLTTDDLVGGVHDGVKKVAIDHRSLHEEVQSGDRVLIDDGLFELTVERIEGHEIFTRVVNGGRLKPRKGVNLPNIKLKISAITDKDRADLAFAYDHDLDYVALSFVRDADDVKELIDCHADHLWPQDSDHRQDREAGSVPAHRGDHRGGRRHHGGARRSGGGNLAAGCAADAEKPHPPVQHRRQAGDHRDADAGIDDQQSPPDPRRGQ